MNIALTYNLRRDHSEAEAELFLQEDVDRLVQALASLGHSVVPVEVSGSPDQIVDKVLEARPELIFNVAEGREGTAREALYPAIFSQLGLPYTGGTASLLLVDLDKRLSEQVMRVQGIRVPRGALITAERGELPDDLDFPLLIKPNYEGSSKGITQDSVVADREQAEHRIQELLESFPEGVNAEEYIQGRELSIPMLEEWPGKLLEIVEHTFEGEGHKIFGYEEKRGEGGLEVACVCPPDLEPVQRQEVLAMADRVFQIMPCPDLGRVDIRLRYDGRPFFIERNPLPTLRPNGSLMTAARACGLCFEEVLERVVRSAARRYNLSPTVQSVASEEQGRRAPVRDQGITIGRFDPGPHNAITDVEGVRVGHVTHCRDEVDLPHEQSKTCVRTGVTAIVPDLGGMFHRHLPAGGFVLNGIGEVSGLIQAIEWGWLETPILLTNTMSVGAVHTGLIRYMLKRFPELGRKIGVTIPLVGETNDSFLNDVRVMANRAEHAIEAVEAASDGPVEQGSVGSGTGMISFDFAGGIGTSSRRLPPELGSYILGVLVQSNFGKMRNLTVDGAVVGRELDPLYPRQDRREKSYGSALVVVATDAPLLSTQLNQIAKRAALGLGRVGSWAATTSGEIIFAFSTGNRTARKLKENCSLYSMSCVSDRHLNGLFEAVVEATEEAVLNAMACSSGMSGRLQRYAPPLPTERLLSLVKAEGHSLNLLPLATG